MHPFFYPFFFHLKSRARIERLKKAIIRITISNTPSIIKSIDIRDSSKFNLRITPCPFKVHSGGANSDITLSIVVVLSMYFITGSLAEKLCSLRKLG